VTLGVAATPLTGAPRDPGRGRENRHILTR